jgi:integrase
MPNMTDFEEATIERLPTLNLLPVSTLKELNGEVGDNRDAQENCQLEAKNDYEAIHEWLREYQASKATYRTYEKEAERFLLWCLYEKKMPLSSVYRKEIMEYQLFLENPQPEALWCQKKGGRGHKRGSMSWKPFAGPLSLSGRATAISALNSLFKFLTVGGYLKFSPFATMRRIRADIKTEENYFKVLERILAPDEWEAMLDTLESYPDTSFEERCKKERLQFLVAILFCLGLRVNELVEHRWNAFRKHNELWWFYLIGKGGKPARIPVNNDLLRAVIRYRSFLKMAPLPTAADQSTLIPSMQNGNAITARQINVIVKKLAVETAKRFPYDIEKQNKLKKFSVHWFRHLSASWQDKAGVKNIQKNMRHAKRETTDIYIHQLDKDRHDDMQKLRISKNKD